MNTRLASRGMMSKIQRLLLAVLVIMILFGSLPAGQAHAWGFVNRWGTPPTVIPGTIILSAGANSAGQVVMWVSGGGATMPSNNTSWGNYSVSAVYELQQWVRSPSGSFIWSKIAATPHTVPVSLGTGPYVNLPYVNFQISRTGTFRVIYKIFWYYSSTRIIAYTEVVPTVASDFSCQYPLLGLPCQTGSGWFKLGN